MSPRRAGSPARAKASGVQGEALGQYRSARRARERPPPRLRAPTSPASRGRHGVSVAEIVIAALIIGSSAIPIMELIRSSTASLSMSETEVAVRGFATDVLNRFAGPPVAGSAPLLAPQTAALLAAPVPADVLLASDPYLVRGVPALQLEPLLKRAACTVKLTITKPSDPALTAQPGLDVFNLTAAWVDPGGRRKEITLAMLVAH